MPRFCSVLEIVVLGIAVVRLPVQVFVWFADIGRNRLLDLDYMILCACFGFPLLLQLPLL